MLRNLLAVTLLVSCLPAVAQERVQPQARPEAMGQFSDVPRGHWAFDAVLQMRRRGILKGYPSTGPVTPAKPVRPVKAVKPVPGAAKPFADVPTNHFR